MALTEVYEPNSTQGWVDQYGTRFSTEDSSTLVSRCGGSGGTGTPGMSYDTNTKTFTITGNAVLRLAAGDDADYNESIGIYNKTIIFDGNNATFGCLIGSGQNNHHIAFVNCTIIVNNCRVGGASGACLLYTSPSPRDRTRSRMPSSA